MTAFLHQRISVPVVLGALIFLHCFIADFSASATPANAIGSSLDEVMQRWGLSEATQPNRYVAASPLIVAAVCSDGIAMIAAHTASQEEKLLRAFDENVSGKAMNSTTWAFRWKDFQYGHAGPSRISRIDRFGTHLMSAGWRADCDVLAEKIRSIASKEVALFGRPHWGLPYGRLLAEEATYFLCRCRVLEAYRLPSCVGLLATCGDYDYDDKNDSNDGAVGSLWMIDVNGWCRVRSLAIGGGRAPDNDQNCTVVAQLVNAKLQDIEFRNMTMEEALSHMLAILSGDGGTDKDGNITCSLVPNDSEIEIAFAVANSGGRLRRLSLSSFGMANSRVAKSP